MRAAEQMEKLKTLIEKLAKEVKKYRSFGGLMNVLATPRLALPFTSIPNRLPPF